MNPQQTSVTEDFEQLFKKTTEANKIFIEESTKFLERLGSSKIKSGEQLDNGKQIFKDALHIFVKLNIQHASNLVDLGIAVTKRMNQQFDFKKADVTPPDNSPVNDQPAFILNVSSAAGTTALVPFILDSDKKDPVYCQLKQSDYTLQNNSTANFVFETSFSPQSFQLLYGEPQKVEIQVKIPAGAAPGVYRSNILVDGFEHSFFSLFIHVTAPNDIINKLPNESAPQE